MNTFTVGVRRDNTHLFRDRTHVGLDVANLQGIESLLLVYRTDDPTRVDTWASKDSIPYTDLKAARVLMRYLNGDLRYSARAKTWRLWNGMVYDIVDPDTVPKMVGRFADAMAQCLALVEQYMQADANDWYAQQNVDSITDQARVAQIEKQYKARLDAYNAQYKEHRFYRDRLHSKRGYLDLVEMLRQECAASEDLYDADTSILVLENGVLDLDETCRQRTVSILPHDPIRPVSKFASVKHDPEAVAPNWERYLERSVPDEETREYLRRWCGAAMLGKPIDKGFLNLLGPQDSGKSIFVDVLVDLMGGYASAEPPSTFVKKRGGGDKHFDLHELRGKRFVVTSETGDGQALDDDLLKRLTGGDKQKTRTLFQGFVEWEPQCTIFIASNHPLRFNVTDAAMSDRLKPISFPHTFIRAANAPEHLRADLGLKAKLRGEKPGILNWVLKGLISYATEGIGFEPAAVGTKRKAIVNDIDNRHAWLDDMLASGRLEAVPEELIHDFEWSPRNARLKAGDAYHSYVNWCGSRGETPSTDKALGKVVREDYPDTATSGGVRFLGLHPTSLWHLKDDQLPDLV